MQLLSLQSALRGKGVRLGDICWLRWGFPGG